MNKQLIICSLFFLFFISCKTHSPITKTTIAPPPKSSASTMILDSMRAHAFHFDWFSAKAKFEITQGNDKTEFTASFRIRNDSAIWVSISPALGLEVARVLITRDSIRVIDRLNKEYYSKDYSFFKTYTSLPVDLITLQNLIEGNPLFVDGKQFEVTRTDSSYLLKWEEQMTSNSLTLDNRYRNLLQNIMDGPAKSVSVTAEQYDIQYTPSFSLWRKIQLVNLNETQIVITFSKVKINEPLKLPFNVKEQQ
jgi:hypothetical protein